MMSRQAENGLDTCAFRNFLWGSGSTFQPGIEVFNFYEVLDRDIHHRHLNGVHSIGKPHHPIVAANRHKPESHGLKKTFSSDLDSVFDAFHIFDGDATRTRRHNESNLPYSLFVRHDNVLDQNGWPRIIRRLKMWRTRYCK